jgi:uncharacterized membrane protein
MKAWLELITEPVIVAIDALALLVIVVGTVEVLGKLVRAAIRPMTERERRNTWLRYARWLVAALTLQLAADIVETSVTSDWQTIGRLGAIAVIRTFLNYFLEHDVEQEQRSCGEPGPEPAASPPEANR